MNFENYALNITPLLLEDGGGFMASFPELPGCIADGETIEEAILQARDAFKAWSQAEIADKGKMPKPELYQ